MIVLPFPPSVNGLFRRHNGAHLSAAYKAWRDEAGMKLNRQQVRHHDGAVTIRMWMRAPDRRPRDIDNYIKPVIDLLVRHGIIQQDHARVVRGIHADWIDEGDPRVQVIILGDGSR
jgi:Holliday junction resolvase RusA-like endonuclease